MDHTTIPLASTEPSLSFTCSEVISAMEEEELSGFSEQVCVGAVYIYTCDRCFVYAHVATLFDDPLSVIPELVVEGGENLFSLNQRHTDHVPLFRKQTV